MKRFILERYYKLMNRKEDNKEEIKSVIEHDRERADKALKEIYKLFGDEIESDEIESILVLAVAYIIET